MFLLKNIEIPLVDGLLFSIIAIAIVFLVLVVIILAVAILSKIKFNEKKKEDAVTAPVVTQNTKKLTMEDIKDEDMMVAALIATAEYVDETKEKDVRLVSIKQIG